MAKKDAIAVPTVTSSEEVILELFVSVAKHQLGMTEAGAKLRAYVDGLPEQKKAEMRDKARSWGMYLHAVSEGFLQELTVIGAQQD